MDYAKRKELIEQFNRERESFGSLIWKELDINEKLLIFLEWLNNKGMIDG